MEKGILIQLFGLLIILIFYHVAEYILHKKHHPNNTKLDSFLITPEYLMAFGFGLVEYAIERYFFIWKSNLQSFLFYFGTLCVFVGLYIRFDAILTAGASFTHRVQYRKQPGHKLITHGIYKYIRHPGYLGFFIFAVGTQIALKNPVSTVLFCIVLWHFFSDRIQVEEKYLLVMFPEYESYRSRTRTWIPFVN